MPDRSFKVSSSSFQQEMLLKWVL